jgi:hypothetical protein
VAIEAGSGRGVGRYAAYADEPGRSKFAITVADDWQGRGIGSALSRRLLIRAREEGVRVVEAIALADNRAALSLLRGLGFRVCSFDGGAAALRLHLRSGSNTRRLQVGTLGPSRNGDALALPKPNRRQPAASMHRRRDCHGSLRSRWVWDTALHTTPPPRRRATALGQQR